VLDSLFLGVAGVAGKTLLLPEPEGFEDELDAPDADFK